MQPESTRPSERCPFRPTECGDLSPLRRALEAVGFTEEALAKTVLAGESRRPLDVSSALRRTAADSPYNALVRLFVLGRSVPEAAARRALAPAELEPLLALGLLRRGDGGIRAAVALRPYEDFFVLCDFWPDFLGEPVPRDYVPGVAPASRTLAGLTVRRQVESALDLGTGMGIQALWAARHAGHVIGTDTNPRALNFAALNARLNGLANIELRRGDLYEPVAGCQFDLIVANPPFVISPSSDYEYRDSGLPGDTVCERVVRGAPPLLRDGGFCTIEGNWHHQDDDDWAERPTRWLEGCGCDAWILCSATQDVLGYAADWLGPDRASDPARHERLLDEWLAYYERLGIGRISSGAVVLRRRSARANWLRAEKAPAGQPAGSCSAQIQRLFAAHDFLQEATGDQDLLGQAFALAPEHQLEHVMQAEGGRWVVKAARLSQTEGLPFVANVDRCVGTVLAGCDGGHTLRELVADLAAGLRMDPQRIAPACVGVIRKLLETGFLTVARRSGHAEGGDEP